MSEPAPPVPLNKVEWRVDSKPTQGDNPRCRYVPYVSASILAGLLDQWVGPDNWSDRYEPGQIDGHWVLWCHLSVRFDGDWVTKCDLGTPSDMESQKGAVSDAFKRAACLKWGVGRNVYDLPTLWAQCKVSAAGKAFPTDGTNAELLAQLRRYAPASVDGQTGEILRPTPEHHEVEAAEPKARKTAKKATKATKATGARKSGERDPLADLNGLNLSGAAVGKLRRALRERGVPWPPMELDADQQAAFYAALAEVAEAAA